MSDKKYLSMAVCKTLLSIQEPVSDARLIFQESKCGQTGLSLDVRMRSILLESQGPAWKISWKTSKRQGTNMTLENPVISPMSITLSEDDSRIRVMKYKPGKLWLFKGIDLTSYDPELIEILDKATSVFKIDDICLDQEADIVYKLIPEITSMRVKEKVPIWLVGEEFLEQEFIPIDQSTLRFLQEE